MEIVWILKTSLDSSRLFCILFRPWQWNEKERCLMIFILWTSSLLRYQTAKFKFVELSIIYSVKMHKTDLPHYFSMKAGYWKLNFYSSRTACMLYCNREHMFWEEDPKLNTILQVPKRFM